ncbi:MAG: DNA-binding protein [Blastocatellia bacterium]|nr:DNA-binding protein [Blastocatellia bacterium]
MPILEIDLDTSLGERVQNAALQLNMTPEDFLRFSLEAKLAEVEHDFQQAVDYVVAKNTELYQRLA